MLAPFADAEKGYPNWRCGRAAADIDAGTMRIDHRASCSLRAGRTGTAALLATTLLLPVLSCKKKDPEKCQQALATTRQALTAEDFALASQWREYAYKHCDDAAGLQALDQELVNKQAETNRRAQEQATKKAELGSVLQLFMRWASENRMTPQNASKLVQCDPVPEGTPKDKEKSVGATPRATSILATPSTCATGKPSPTRFVSRCDRRHRLSCADLGEHRVLRTWDIPVPGGGTVKRTHCELTSGPLAGMQELATAAITELHVLSPKYAQRDPRITQ